MTANPFVATLHARGVGNNRPYGKHLSVSDVANEFALDPARNNTSDIQFPEDVEVYDLDCSENGSDTIRFKVSIDGQDKGLSYIYAMCRETVPRPHVPVKFILRRGSALTLQQSA